MLIGEKFDCTEIARRYNLKNYILFNCTVSYELKIDIDVYSTSINDIISKKLNESKLSRQLIFAVTERCIKNQALPSKSTFCFDISKGTYSTFVTDIDVFVEVFDVDNVDELFDEEKNGLMEILQNSLSIFSSKYNESMSGQDFWIPIASEIGAQFSRYISRDYVNGSYSVKKNIISSGFFMPKSENHKKEDLHRLMQEPYVMWRYFFNKAKYAYDTYDNLECILASAISIESYIQEKINKNNLNQNLDEYLINNKIKNISFFQLTNFLQKNNLINKNDENFINKIFGKISGMRNDIVHGKITTPILSREKAQIAKTGIVELYSRIENLTPIIQEEPKLPLEYYFQKAFSYLNKGYEYIKQKKYTEAIEIFSNNIQKGIYLDYSYYNRGLCFFNVNEYEKSIDDFSKCIVNNFYVLESLYNKTLSEIRINRNQDAINNINLALAIDNTKAKLYAIKGIAYTNQCKFDEAIKEFDTSLKIEENVQVLYNRGVAYNRKGNLVEAFKDFERAIELKKDTKYLYEIGLLYQENKDYNNAIRLINMLIEKFPDNYEYLTIRGNCYISLGEYDYAQKDFDKCIELRKNYFLGYMNLAIIYMNQKNFDKAYKYLILALEKDSNNKNVLKNLDILYVNYAINTGTYIEEAKKSIIRLLSKEPNNTDFLEAKKILLEK